MKTRKLLAAAACIVLASAASCSKNEESAEKASEANTTAAAAQNAGSIVFHAEGDITDADLDSISQILSERTADEIPDIGLEFSEDYDAKTVTMTFDKENAPKDNIDVFAEKACEKRLLEFRKGEKADDEVILTNDDVEKAENVIMAETDGSMSDYVSIQFNDHGTEVFADVTSELAGTDTPLSIWFDGELLSAPTVRETITNGTCIISGDFDTTAAAELAKKIDSAPLPYEVSVKEINY